MGEIKRIMQIINRDEEGPIEWALQKVEEVLAGLVISVEGTTNAGGNDETA